MSKKADYYAVITGDIVRSSDIDSDERRHLLDLLKDSFASVEEIFPGILHSPFEIHRGDSFQSVLIRPEQALGAAIIIRIKLRGGFLTPKGLKKIDARMAIGIGTVDFLPDGHGGEGEGEAFRLSGPYLDRMKGDRRLSINTPQKEVNAELDTECNLFDVLINKWTKEQAQVILLQIRKFTQEISATELQISQPAVRLRLKGAGGWAVEKFLQRYTHLVSQIIDSRTDNERL